MTTTPRERLAEWWRRYGRATWDSADLELGVWAAFGTILLVVASDQARASAPAFAVATAGISAGLLGIVLAAMTIVTAFVNRTFVMIVGDLREALMPFATVAVVAATSLLLSLAGMLALAPLQGRLEVLLVALIAGATAWAIGGVVQLVFLSIWFARVRATELQTLEEAEQIRAQRLAGRPRPEPPATSRP
jgi:hypothetical protein